MNQFDQQIKAALLKLNPEDDSHWTQNGSPAIQVVSELSQIEGLKRGQITAAAPTFTRENPKFEAPAEENSDKEEKEEGEELDVLGEKGEDEKEDEDFNDDDFGDEDEEDEEDEEEVEVDELSESEIALAAADAELAKAQEIAAEAQKKVAAATLVRDAILEERAKDVHPHQNQLDIMQHLESQKQLRIQRAQRAMQVVYVPKAPIDQAMARKKGFGHGRPSVPLKKPE